MPNICNNVIDNYPGITIRFRPDTGETIFLGGKYKDTLLSNQKNKEKPSITDIRSHIIKSDQKKILSTTQEHIENQTNWNIEYRIKYKNKTLWLREQAQFSFCNKQPVVDLYIQDVTDFKEQHKKLKQELTTVSKTADMKNEFFASMSHEIRTPMNAVMGMAQILAKTQMDFEQKQYLGTIVNASNALVQIINDILDVSKLEAGKIDLLAEETDLEKLCLDVCHLLAMRAEEKQVELFLDFTPTEQNLVITDGGRIRQILINLIGNAIKFTEKGHVVLRVYLASKDDTSIYRFSVEDTGIGIPAESQHTVFKAFAQADATITKNFGGTGLGLQICQKLVSLMQGEIGLESEVGKGSTFWFSLPIKPIAENNLKTVNLKDKQCLLVDNNPVSLNISEKILHQTAMSISSIDDAEDVLAVLTDSSNKYDYIIIDKNLKGLSGLDLAKLIKQDKRYINVPIILITPLSLKENRSELFKAGINAYLSKPLSPSLLKNALIAADKEQTKNEAIYISNKNINTDEAQNHYFNGKVLIADDLEVNQFILNAMLSQYGLVSEFANNGLEAVDKVKNNDYDLIFMDCRMPIMDGFEATGKIKSLPKEKSKVPIIALTANAGERDKQQCFDAGMDGFLSKPYTDEEIVNIIKNWLVEDKIEINTKVEEASETNETVTFDLTQFETIRTTLGEEFNTFAEGMPNKFRNYQKDISEALKDGKMSIVHEKSHALKGLAALIGAKLVSEIAFALENAGEEKDLEAANIALSKLDFAIAHSQTLILENTNPEMTNSVILF